MESATCWQILGVVAVLAGIALSTVTPKPGAARGPVAARLRRLAYEVLSFRA